ncbi:MAG: DegV family protein, partial [Lysobacterales bacterium]
SVAQGLLAIDAAEAAAAGFDVDAVVARVESMRERTRLFALIADPSYGVRGGRAPRLAEPLTRWLRVRLIVGMNRQGRMSLAGLLGGNAQVPERFGAWIARRCRGNSHARWRINIGHCDDPQGAARLADALRNRLPSLDACWIGDAGTGIGAHAGPGALIVGVQEWLPLRAFTTSVKVS